MATTAKRVTAALTRAGLRGRVQAIDDNFGEVVMWRDGMGIPVWSVREALREAGKDPAAVSLGRKGGRSTSAAKTAASRENGKRGGPPKKPAE